MDMLNWIWVILMLASIVCAACTGRMEALSAAVLQGAGSAVELCLATLGMLCFWTGLLHAAEQGGLTRVLARILSPLLRRLFPRLRRDSPALGAICMNLTANILGLGNAATPLGLAAMQALRQESDAPAGVADNAMVLFVVLNTASLQIVPTFLGTVRAKYGAAQPFDILPAIWLTSVAGLLAAVCAAKLMEIRRKKGAA